MPEVTGVSFSFLTEDEPQTKRELRMLNCDDADCPLVSLTGTGSLLKDLSSASLSVISSAFFFSAYFRLNLLV